MNKIKEIQGVAFDLDGTLVNSAPGLTAAVDQALCALALPPAGEARVISWIGNGADVLMARARIWALRQQCQTTVVDDDNPLRREQARVLRKLFDHYYARSVQTGTSLYPDVVSTLTALRARGLPLALVTNKPTRFVAPLLQALDIAKYFAVVIGGDDVEHKKPHPQPLLLAARQLSLRPQALLFVGDSRNDIQAARAAGCCSVGLTGGYNHGENITLSEPDYVFDRLRDLLPALGLLHENQESRND